MTKPLSKISFLCHLSLATTLLLNIIKFESVANTQILTHGHSQAFLHIFT